MPIFGQEKETKTMSKSVDPHSRSIYRRDIVGGVTVLKIKGELRLLAKMTIGDPPKPLDPNRCAVSEQDYRSLERQLLGKVDTGSSISVANPETNTLVVLNKWTSVRTGTVEFWFQA
jgi:hypothetical protein